MVDNGKGKWLTDAVDRVAHFQEWLKDAPETLEVSDHDITELIQK